MMNVAVSEVSPLAHHSSALPMQKNREASAAEFLGIQVHPMEMHELHDAVAMVIREDEKCLVAHHNMHSLYLAQKEKQDDPRGGMLARYYGRARWTLMDGMSIVLLAKMHGFAVDRDHRIAYNQTLPHLLELANREGWRILYLGSSETVAREGGEILRQRFPGLALQTQHGFFRKEKAGAENQEVLAAIAAFRPHILFVGMGMPIQERWIEENFVELAANVIVPSGATLDYFAGALPKPPAWIGRIGLEWAYRLANEPRRLAFRYLGEPWFILLSVVRSRMRAGKYGSWSPQPPVPAPASQSVKD